MLTKTHSDALVSASQVQPGTKDFVNGNMFSHAMVPSRSVMSKLKPINTKWPTIAYQSLYMFFTG